MLYLLKNGLKSEITESFITGMKGLFEEHYVSMPEEKYDVLEIDGTRKGSHYEMETTLNEQIEKNISLNKSLEESTLNLFSTEFAKVLLFPKRIRSCSPS